MTLREAYINAITDHAVRAWVYLFLWKSGAIAKITPPPTFTTQIEHVLIEQYKAKRILDPANLRRGDVCFSRNQNGTPGPDHVYAFHSHLPNTLATRTS
jgi:hypothetical protein